jgi:hypothetical protein
VGRSLRRRAQGARPSQHRRHARARGVEPSRRLLRRRRAQRLAEDGLLPGRFGRVEELYARGDDDLKRALVQAAVDWLWQHDVHVIRSWVALDEPGAELLQSLGFEPEATRFGLYRDSSTSNCTSSP